MYRPPYSRVDDPAAFVALLAENPFATLVRVVDGAPRLAFAPLVADGPDLLGHLARANDVAVDLGGAELTAVFHGPHAYVSPTWYGAPEDHVPTWNYVVAEARGRVVLEDAATVVRRMVEVMEPTWRAAAAVEAQLSRAIVGFRIVDPRIEVKAKLSQNRDADDRARVLERADPAIAAWMRRT